MGILIQKKQSGGSLFASPEYMKFNSQIPVQNVGGGSGRRATSNDRPTLDKSKPVDPTEGLDGALPSDVQFYRNEQTRISAAIKKGFDEKGAEFDHTPEFAMLTKERYNLDTKQAQLKNMAAMYSKSATSYKAGDEPAIVNRQAIVEVLDSRKADNTPVYEVVGFEELLANAKRYRILTGDDILMNRRTNPDFSGFTTLGFKADQIINIGYGSDAYEANIDKVLKNVGYVKGPGKLISTDGNTEFDFKSLVYDPNTQLIDTNPKVNTDTNARNLEAVYSSLMDNPDTYLNTYLENTSVAFLHKKIKEDKIILDDNQNSINRLVEISKRTQLAKKLQTSLTIEENTAKKTKSTGTGDGDGSKDMQSNIFQDAELELLSDYQTIEINNLANISNKGVKTIINKVPTAFIRKGAEFLETGFGTNNKTDSDKEKSEFNNKTLAHNTIIRDFMGGQSEMTTFDGTPIVNYTDGSGLKNIVLAEDVNLQMLLAPVEKNNLTGKFVVNFTNAATLKALQAIDATYARLKIEGISQMNLAAGDKGIIKRAEDIAKEEFARLVGKDANNLPEIKATLAFKVNYEAKSDAVDDPDAGWGVDDGYLHSIIDHSRGVWGTNYAKETLAFIPISTSFWNATHKKGAFAEQFETFLKADKVEGALKSSNTVSLFNIATAAGLKSQDFFNSNKKKYSLGGKLLSTDELKELLFN